jgi:hypothetical protein
MPVTLKRKTHHRYSFIMNDLRCSKQILYVLEAFRYARDGPRKALTQASFSSRLPTEKCQGEVVSFPLEGGFSVLTLTLPHPKRLFARKDHPRTSLIGHQPIDPLTSQRPEHRSGFVFAAGKRDDRLFWRTA